MLATLADAAFHRPGWVYEEKYDGYRLLAYKVGKDVRLRSRNGLDRTASFPEIAHAVAGLRPKTLLLDGEVVAFDAKLVSRFQLLQQSGAPHVYAVFDCLWIDGRDLREEPLAVRRAALERAIGDTPHLFAARRLATNGLAAHRVAQKRGYEGLVAKDPAAPYTAGRSSRWVKVKVKQAEELVVGGYTAPAGTRSHFGALLMGAYEGASLRYVGKVGTGFTAKTLASLHAAFQPLVRPTPAFVDPPRMRDVTWLTPKLVAQVLFTEWTADMKLRQPVFLGLRDDKSPRECVLPKRKSSSTPKAKRAALPVRVSNPDKVFWPDQGWTKLDLIHFYDEMFPHLQPYVKDRLLSLERCPDGVGGPCFYQKDKPAGLPADTPTKRIDHPKHAVDYVVGGRRETQLALANLGCIAVHVWGSRAKTPRQPDWVCFDLDPDSGKFADAARAGLRLKEALDSLGLVSFPKTSGMRGLHVFVPIRVGPDTDEVRRFADRVGRLLARAYPDQLTTELTISARRGRVYLDAGRNGFAQTVAAPYCVRNREGAPVSTPLLWAEVKPSLDPASFNLGSMARRLEKPDPWADFWSRRQPLGPALRAVAKL